MTSKEYKSKKPVAIKQIERRFNDSKKVKLGMSKGPEYPGVTATKVIDFIPFLQMIPSKSTLVSCDDFIEDELKNKKPENNDFLLFNFNDHIDKQRKYALYKFNDIENVPDEVKDATLG